MYKARTCLLLDAVLDGRLKAPPNLSRASLQASLLSVDWC